MRTRIKIVMLTVLLLSTPAFWFRCYAMDNKILEIEEGFRKQNPDFAYWKVIDTANDGKVKAYVALEPMLTSNRLYRVRAYSLHHSNGEVVKDDDLTLFAYVCLNGSRCTVANPEQLFFTDAYIPDDVIIDLFEFIEVNRNSVTSDVVRALNLQPQDVLNTRIIDLSIDPYHSPGIPVEYRVIIEAKVNSGHRDVALTIGRENGKFFVRSVNKIRL